MTFEEYTHVLESILYGIKSRSCASSVAIQRKYNVSRRTSLRMVDNLRKLGHDIRYSKCTGVYYLQA